MAYNGAMRTGAVNFLWKAVLVSNQMLFGDECYRYSYCLVQKQSGTVTG